MRKLLLILMMTAFAAVAAHAAEGGDASTDIVERTINFVIFAAILYFLLAEPIKNYFTGRSQAIADELQKVQDALKASKSAKEAAEKKIEDAHKFAEELLEAAKKENKILHDKILTQCETDIENLQKQSSALMEFEQRNMVRDVVDEIMGDVLTEEGTGLDKESMAQIIMKKVA